MMQLQTLLEAVPGAQVRGAAEREIADIAYDSRLVGPGALFVAVPTVGSGPRSGGYHFIETAIARGAVAVVAQEDAPVHGACSIRVPDARAALADLAAAFFDHPSRQLLAFATTGTDGKTTTSYLLEAIFGSMGCETGLIGTIETKIGPQRIMNADRITTPESLDLQRTLRNMVQAGVTHVALEASSHALALQRLRSCHFEACALTNITGDHVEFHGSWEAYVAAKALLFTEVGRDAPAVLNRDDDSFEFLSSQVTGRVRSYSRTTDATVRAREVVPCEGGSRFDLESHGSRAGVTLHLPGPFNVSNALAAAGMALAAGVSLSDVARGLSGAQPPPGRMQAVHCGQPFQVIVDYGHTPQAFRSVLSALRETCEGRLIAVFGATGNRDRGKRPVLAGIAHQYADFSIITNEDPFGEPVEAIMAEVAAGMPPAEEGNRFVLEPDRARAIELAVSRAEPGDTVVVLGKGHETSIVAGDRKQPWSDTGTARAALERHL